MRICRDRERASTSSGTTRTEAKSKLHNRIVMVHPGTMRWTRDELLIVLNLYHKLPFGKVSSRQPVIIDLAARMGRTPSSVSMKLGNFASFDVVLQMRGIRGLTGASNLDREVWDEFHANPEELVAISQERFDALFVESKDETTEVIPGDGIRRRRINPPTVTEAISLTKQRRGQDFFRDVVLNNYANRCGITGLPVRELLVASHILSWKDHAAERLNVRNGICLNRLHDAAFDQGLIGFDDEIRLILSPKLRAFLPQKSVAAHFEAHELQTLELPDEGIPPDLGFLSRHRTHFALS